MSSDYEYLREFATTPAQHLKLDAIAQSESVTEAAKLVGVHRSNMVECLARLKYAAAKRGYAPQYNINNPLPDGQELKGISRLVDGNGETKLVWYKSDKDRERQKQIYEEAVKALTDSIKPVKAVKPPKTKNNDLLNVYVITDYHLGMLSWDEETGDNWDTDIAEEMLYGWFSQAIKSSPDSESAVFAQLGDFLHWDGLDAVTPQNKNILDADTRFQKIVRVTIHLFRRIITDLLKKHKTVHVIMAEGNHDPASSVWLRELFNALYQDEPRVVIDLSPDPYYCYEHGTTSLFFHHGHKRKPVNIDDVFVAKFREVFGRTKYSYAHMGHLHHRQVIESNLMIVEQHRTLAANDAYASRGGWMTGRDASVITYHSEYGEVGRVTINPAMIGK